MQKLLKLLVVPIFLFFSTNVNAALPQGSIAPDWTLTDLDGNTHHLYSILDSGKAVILDFSATWCGPCWNYHNNGVLETMWNLYGPNGTNELMVFMVEADGSTNEACLYGPTGCNNSTWGNWVAGTPYPIFNLTGGDLVITSQYQITYWPTLYAISPVNKKIFEVGQPGVPGWESWVFDSFSLASTAVTTDGDCTSFGAIDLIPTGGYGNLSYSWSNGETTQDLSNIPSGVYSVTITDVHQYSIEEYGYVVNNNGAPVFLNTNYVIDESCFAAFDGEISVSGSGGGSPLNYTWSNGFSGPINSNLGPGTYSVTISDDFGCQETETYSITGQAPLIGGVSTTDATCNESNGLAIATVVGGVLPYTYDIGEGETPSMVFTNLSAGDYELTVTDDNECEILFPFTIENLVLAEADAGIDQQLDCDFPAIVIDGISMGEVDFVLWEDSDGNVISNENSVDIDTSGVFTFIVVDINGCVVEDEVMVIENFTTPGSDAGVDQELNCDVVEVTLDGVPSGSYDEVEWVDEDGNLLSDTTDVDIETPGLYYFIVYGPNGCFSEDEVEVTQDVETPDAIGGDDDVLDCSSASVILDGEDSTQGDNLAGTWTDEDGNIVGNYTAEVTEGGIYTLTILNTENGCFDTDEVEITEDFAVPVLTVNDGLLNCDITSVELCADTDPANSVEWTTPSGAVIVQTCIEVSVAGDYTAKAIAPNGCEVSELSIVSQDSDVPIIDVEEADVLTCDINLITLAASLNGDPNDFEILWSTLDGNIVSGEDSLEPEVDAAGNYVITVLNTITGCEASNEVLVTSDADLPNAMLQVDLNDNEVLLTDLSEGEPQAWSWTVDGVEISTEETTTYEFEESGYYNICLTVTNECGDHTTCTEVLYVAPFNVDYTVAHALCFDSNDGSISLDLQGGLPDFIIEWSGPNGFTSDQSELSDLEPGTYTVEVVDQVGNEYNETYDVTAPDAIIPTAEFMDLLCNGDKSGSIDVDATGGTGVLLFAWDDGNTGPTRSDLSAGVYTVNITDENNCVVSESFELVEPDALITDNVVIINEVNGDQAGVVDINVSGGTEPYSYEWNNGSTEEDLFGVPSGEYTCTVIDANGCLITVGPVMVDNITSTELLDHMTSLTVMPNPASDYIVIDMEFVNGTDLDVSIIAIDGRLLYSSNHADRRIFTETIDVSNYESGLYIIRIGSEGNAVHRKIVIE